VETEHDIFWSCSYLRTQGQSDKNITTNADRFRLPYLQVTMMSTVLQDVTRCNILLPFSVMRLHCLKHWSIPAACAASGININLYTRRADPEKSVIL